MNKKIKKKYVNKKMDIYKIVSDQTILLSSYIDQLRSYFNILKNYELSVDKIYYDQDIYTILYKIIPSGYLGINTYIAEFNKNISILLNNEIINILSVITKIDTERILIEVQFKLKEIDILPKEIVIDILIDLPYKDIKNYCLTSTEANKICQLNYFWMKKLIKEYPDLEYLKNNAKGYYELKDFVNKFYHVTLDIRKLINLKTLLLYNNKIKAIPESIGLLNNLDFLNLKNNNIELIPESIGLLNKLEYLNLKNNKIEVIPDSIGNLINLKYLDLKNNNIEVIPDSIGKLINLEYLDLNNNNNIEVIPDSIGNLNNLITLKLNNNNIEEIPDSIGLLNKLNYLFLSNNNIQVIPESIGNLNNLLQLDLINNKIEVIPDFVSNLNNLIIDLKK